MKTNVTEDEFVRRMGIVAETLREYDPDCNFRRMTHDEEMIKKIRRESDPPGQTELPDYSFVLLQTGSQKKASIHISWIEDGVKPRLFDLSVGDADVSLTNRINSLAGKPFRGGE